MTSTSQTAAPSQTASLSETASSSQSRAPISDHFDAMLPHELREAGRETPFESFIATYGPSGGPVRLGSWECEGARLGGQPQTFRATLAVGDRIETATFRASGAVAALTGMLHERGIAVELTRFHQLRSESHTATFVCGSDGRRTEWAMGWCEDATQSALRALIACANRLGNKA
jgi:hypothetical protein